MSGCDGQTEDTTTSSGGPAAPCLEPANELSKSKGGSTVDEMKPTLVPPSSSVGETEASSAAPTLTPLSMAAEGGITGWINNKRVSALWSINQNRNSWVYITNVGWKKLADNSDSAVVALSILAAHAKQTQTNYNYREESDGKIHETYVW